MTERPLRILHLLSQRPGFSGSGVFLQAMVREAAAKGYEQQAVVGAPASTSAAELPPLQPSQLTVVPFESDELPFPVPGMSDVMPYPSTVFSRMTPEQAARYREAFRTRLTRLKQTFKPHVVHAHHVWLAAALAREVFNDTPVIVSSHNTELRQLENAALLGAHVLPWANRFDKVCVLTDESLADMHRAFGIEHTRMAVTGAGFRAELFHPAPRPRSELFKMLQSKHGIHLPHEGKLLAYVGRLSTPKGVPYLLQAVERLRADGACPKFTLLLVGAVGSGEDGRRVAELARQLAPHAVMLGAQPQEAVATVLQCSDMFVLPSLYEGLPLVMLEAMACGCRAVVSALPTVLSWVPREWIESRFCTLVPKLQTVGADTPVEADVPRFVRDLTVILRDELSRQLTAREQIAMAAELGDHSWTAVFERYEEIYRRVLAQRRN